MDMYQIRWLLSSVKVVVDSERGRNTKQMKDVEVIKSMVGT